MFTSGSRDASGVPNMLDSQYARRRAPQQDPAAYNPTAYGHNRTRTTSSNTFPDNAQVSMPGGAQAQLPMHLAQPQAMHQRRSPSVNTLSTVSSGGGGGGGMAPPAAFRMSPTTEIRRSISSRSGGGGAGPIYTPSTSYVALLRKQKATVWCDRAQYEDPRLMAAQRAAKMRANLEVTGTTGGLGVGGGGGAGRTSTGLSSAGGKVAAKIRHHGKAAVVGYSPESNYVGVGGVPLRLSATEVEGEDSDEDDAAIQRMHHRRTGSSGRNSTASGRRAAALRGSGSGAAASSSQAGGSRRWSPGDTPERTGSLVEEKEQEQQDATPAGSDSVSVKAQSFASGSSGERLDSVPDLGGAARLASKSLMHATVTREKSVKNPEDLKRRGSVDERTMTLTSGRLYIANPD